MGDANCTAHKKLPHPSPIKVIPHICNLQNLVSSELYFHKMTMHSHFSDLLTSCMYGSTNWAPGPNCPGPNLPRTCMYRSLPHTAVLKLQYTWFNPSITDHQVEWGVVGTPPPACSRSREKERGHAMPRTALLAWLRRANCSAQESGLNEERWLIKRRRLHPCNYIVRSRKISLLFKFTAENPGPAQLFFFLAKTVKNSELIKKCGYNEGAEAK